jgi:hypothetical protein
MAQLPQLAQTLHSIPCSASDPLVPTLVRVCCDDTHQRRRYDAVFEIEPSTNCRRQRLLRILRAAEVHMLPHMLAYTRTAWVEWTVSTQRVFCVVVFVGA